MQYHIAIIDDERADIAYVRKITESWAEARDCTLKVDTFPSAEAFLFHYEEEKDYDILLLDIEMGAMDGVSMAKAVRRDNEAVQIIFIYLLKPLKQEKLFEVLDRAVSRIQRNEKLLTIEVGREMTLIPLYEIIYIDVQKNDVTIHAKKEYTIRETLSEIEKQLDDAFYRLGRSAIVNLNRISRITRTDVYLKDGTCLPLPRGQYDRLNRAIIERI